MDRVPAEAVDRFRADLADLIGSGPGGLGLAVSGGPDSFALLLLACAAMPGRIRAATVDHGLRPEAGNEAALVGRFCAELGVEHELLCPAQPITGNIQSSARAARYALLDDWRRRHRLDWIATAHHADDQAETLLMRLNRGSGIAGLSAIRAINGPVVRPLLKWRRSDLAALVAAAGVDPVDDATNRDDRFDRVRMRKNLASADWIEPLALARSASALAEAEEALDWTVDQLWADRSTVSQDLVGLDPAGLPAEFRRRLVCRALLHFCPAAEIRGDDLGRLVAALDEGRTATLAGVKAVSDGRWHFSLAPPRRG